MNKDGKMDKLEFSIAMKLIKLKLQGTSLPSALPIIMKQPPVRAPTYGTCLISYLSYVDVFQSGTYLKNKGSTRIKPLKVCVKKCAF